jgi:hypothetical protein
VDTLKPDANISDQILREMLQGNDSITELDLSAEDRTFGLGGCPRLTFMTLKTVAELSSLTSLTLCRSVSVRTLPSCAPLPRGEQGFKERSSRKSLQPLLRLPTDPLTTRVPCLSLPTFTTAAHPSWAALSPTHLHYGCPPLLDSPQPHPPSLRLPPDPLVCSAPQATDTRLRPLLRSLVNLETLSLRDCKKHTNKTMHEVAELTRLTSLDVSSTNFKDDGAVAISRMPNLTSLRMQTDYQMGVRGFEALGRMPALTHLDASSCFTATDECLYALGGLAGLRYLDISGWSDGRFGTGRLTYRALDALINFPLLTYLNLSGNSDLRNPEGTKALAELKNALNVNGCQLVGL